MTGKPTLITLIDGYNRAHQRMQSGHAPELEIEPVIWLRLLEAQLAEIGAGYE